MDTGFSADEIDTGRPHPARMYDYLLGGWDNYEVDREAAKRLMATVPRVAEVARLNRAFMHRAVRFVVEQGIRQIVDIGTGIPTAPNIHEIAHEINPDVKVAYVDIDPIVKVHAEALLSRIDKCTFVLGDVRDAAAIVNDPRMRELIDFEQPVAFFLLAILHFIGDEYDPAGAIATLRDAVPAGSYLAMSHGTPEFEADHDEHEAIWEASTVTLNLRPRTEVAALFAGLDLVEPGLVKVPLWRPDDKAGRVNGSWLGLYGGVGVKNG